MSCCHYVQGLFPAARWWCIDASIQGAGRQRARKGGGGPPLGMTPYGEKIDGTDFGSFLFEEPEVFVIFAVNFVRAINGGMPVPRKASILRGCPIINQYFMETPPLMENPKNLPCLPAFFCVADPPCQKCFAQFEANEARLCGEWAVFYHSCASESSRMVAERTLER